MIPSAQIRHLFTVLTAVASVLSQPLYAQVPAPQQNNVLHYSPSAVDDIDALASFSPQSSIDVYLDSDRTQRMTLNAGDVLDSDFPTSVAPGSAVQAIMGSEFYIKYGLVQQANNGMVLMSVRSSQNPSLIDNKVYVPLNTLSQMSIYADPEAGDAPQVFDAVTNEPCHDCGPNNQDLKNQLEQLQPVPEKSNDQDAADQTPVPAPKGNDYTTKNMDDSIQLAFASYSNSSAVSHLVNFGDTHFYTVDQRGRRTLRYKIHGQTYCYRAVKDALKYSHLVSPNFGDGSSEAFDAREDLIRQGFRDLLRDPTYAKIMKNPEMAPKGAILVYEDSRGRVRYVHSKRGRLLKVMMPGHVEIKTANAGEQGYVSINKQMEPAYGHFETGQRRLIGVMVRTS